MDSSRTSTSAIPSTCLVECAFSAVIEILAKKRESADMNVRGDLRTRFTCFFSRVSWHVALDQARGLINVDIVTKLDE